MSRRASVLRLARPPWFRLRRHDELLQVRNAFFFGEERDHVGNAQVVPLAQCQKFIARRRQSLGGGGLLAERFRGWLLFNFAFDLAFEPGEFFLELAVVIFRGGHEWRVVREWMDFRTAPALRRHAGSVHRRDEPASRRAWAGA